MATKSSPYIPRASLLQSDPPQNVKVRGLISRVVCCVWVSLILVGVVNEDDILTTRDIEFDPDVGVLREVTREGPIQRSAVVAFILLMLLPMLLANTFYEEGEGLFPWAAMVSSLLLLFLSMLLSREVGDTWGFSVPVGTPTASSWECNHNCYDEGIIAVLLVLLLVLLTSTLVFSSMTTLLVKFYLSVVECVLWAKLLY